MKVPLSKRQEAPKRGGRFSIPMYCIMMRLLKVMLAAMPHPVAAMVTAIQGRLVSRGKTEVKRNSCLWGITWKGFVAHVSVMDRLDLKKGSEWLK